MHVVAEKAVPRSRSTVRRPDALSVRVRWGDRRLAAQVLSAGGRTRFVVGAAAGADFVAPRAPAVAFSVEAGGPRLRFSDGVVGEVLRNGEVPLSLSDVVGRGLAEEQDGTWDLALGGQDAVRLELGALTVEALPVRAPPRAVTPLDASLDYRWLNILLGVALVASLFVVRAVTAAAEGDGLDDELSASEMTRYRRVLVKPAPPPARAQAALLPDDSKRAPERRDAPPGTPKPKATPPAKGGGQPDARALVARAFAGLGVGEVFGGGGLGNELNRAMGNVVGASNGLGGWALRGTGSGGDLGGPVGIGRLGPKYGPGTGGPKDFVLKKGPSGPPTIDVEQPPGCTPIEGTNACLDKETIRRIIRDHLGQVRYCYESLLQQHPSLHGKVAVRFVVSPSGAVSEATVAQSDVGVAALGDCLTGRVRTWRFPVAKGSLGYVVTYPFVFHRAGT